MTIEIRTPTEDDWVPICHADGIAFGFTYTADEIAERRPVHDLSRFRIAVDNGQIVSTAGSYALDVTLPGAVTVPMGGVTWVSTLATHRRQGIMRQVVEAVHDDIDERGEPLASLSASEGGIYEHLRYGIATRNRATVIDTRLARIRAEYRPDPASVRYVSGDDVIPAISEIWERFRRCRAGEVSRSPVVEDLTFKMLGRAEDGQNAAAYLCHKDGYAVYRTEEHWNNGHPAHIVHLIELAAVTPDAHAALWHTLMSIDLVAEIHSRALPDDDPLPFLLDNQRAVRTTHSNDNIWLNVRDAAICFGARTYRTNDRIVIEVDGKRWAIEGAPDGASCRAVRTRPDLITSHAWFSSLLYGGVLPSTLVAGRRMTARNDDVLRRADLFFTTSLLPHCQSHY
jgi:predicted acetyltransferase